MHSLEVGQLYHPERTQWPERAQYNYDANGHTLTLFFGEPKDREVSAVKKGRWQFGLLLQRPLLFGYGSQISNRGVTRPAA